MISYRTLKAVHALMIILALAAILFILQLASRPASGFTPPPSTGDWIINDTTNWNSGAVLRGNLKIESQGVLILEGANITFDCAQKCQYALDIQGGGTLRASNSMFAARYSSLPYMFKIRTNANVLLDHCTVMDAGAFSSSMDSWGIYVHSSNTTISDCKITRCNVGLLVHGFVSPTITGNNISGNSDRGIWCKYSSPVIGDNRLSGNGYGIYLENDSVPAMLNNEFSDNQKDALWMAAGCRADWVISRPCRWVSSTLTHRGNISIGNGGVLWLQGSSLGMAMEHAGLTVNAGGELRLTGATLQAGGGSDAYYLVVEKGGNLTADSSLIKNAGWQSAEPTSMGLYIAGRGQISSSTILWNHVSVVCDHGTASISNSTLGGNSLDLSMNDSSVRFLNVSYNRSKVAMEGAGSVLEIAWHLSVGAVWQNGRGVRGAALTVRYSAGGTIYDGVPEGGWVRFLEITQRRITPSGTSDTSNISILAKKPGFDDISRSVRVTADGEERMMFSDPSPPTASISSPADGFATNRTSVQFRGTTSDSVGLDSAQYSLDDFPRWTGLFPPQQDPFTGGDWSFNLTNLSQGNHRLSVRAVNEAGMTSFANMSFVVDTEPPELELDEPYENSVLVNQTGVRFRGTTEPGARLFVGDAEAPVAADGSFDVTVNLSEGRNSVAVVARDRAQNGASLFCTVTVDITPPPILILSPPDGLKTRQAEVQLTGRIEPGAKFRVDGSTVALAPDGSFDCAVMLSGGPKTVELYAEDAAGNANSTTITFTRQMEPAQNGGGFMERYGLHLAVGSVAIIAALAAVAVIMIRRKGGKGPSPAAPPPSAGSGEAVVEVLDGDK